MIASIRRGRFCTAARITWLLMILKQLKEKVAWTSSRTWPRVIASSTSWRKRLCYLSWILQPAHGEFLWPSACRAGTFVIASSSPWKRLLCCRPWALVNSPTSPIEKVPLTISMQNLSMSDCPTSPWRRWLCCWVWPRVDVPCRFVTALCNKALCCRVLT